MTDDPAPDYGLIDRAGIGRSVFYPRPDFSPPPPGASDHRIEVEAGVAIAGRFYPLGASLPSLLYFHGNGEVASDYDGIAPVFRQFGMNLFVADYRGYGASGGTPSFAALVSDAHPVLDSFHDLLDDGGFAGPRFLMGRSLGAHPAIELAARRPERMNGLVIESGAGNLRRLMRYLGGEPDGPTAELIDLHSRKIAAISLPVLVIHGAEDELIAVEQAIEFHAALSVAEKELVIIPGAGHNDIMWVGLRQYFESIAAFVKRHG